MREELLIKLTEDVEWNINDRDYEKGEELTVIDFGYSEGSLSENYAHYYDSTLDWIPKSLTEVIK